MILISHADLMFFPCDFTRPSSEAGDKQTMQVECSPGILVLFEVVSDHFSTGSPAFALVARLRGVEAAGDFPGATLRTRLLHFAAGVEAAGVEAAGVEAAGVEAAGGFPGELWRGKVELHIKGKKEAV